MNRIVELRVAGGIAAALCAAVAWGGAGRSEAPTPITVTAPSSAPGAGADGRAEAWWRERHQAFLEEQRAARERRAEACDDLGPDVHYDPRTGFRADERHLARKAAALEACAQARRALDDAHRGLAQLEADARRAGVALAPATGG